MVAPLLYWPGRSVSPKRFNGAYKETSVSPKRIYVPISITVRNTKGTPPCPENLRFSERENSGGSREPGTLQIIDFTLFGTVPTVHNSVHASMTSLYAHEVRRNARIPISRAKCSGSLGCSIVWTQEHGRSYCEYG